MEKVCVITVTYKNRFSYLKQVIERVLQEGVYKVIVVDNNSGSQKTINLTVENEVSNGRIVVVKDKNYAQSTNIIIQAGSGYTIEGSSSTTINTNKGHKTFILKGNTWYII